MTGRPGRTAELKGLAGPKAEKPISLALQGGGAHGAFTWGVLDAIMEDGRLAVEAITGASAGAMNAVVMADGWEAGGADGARAALELFWRRVSPDGGLCEAERRVFDGLLGFWSSALPFASAWGQAWQGQFSPYDAPVDINPLRDTLEGAVDFGRLNRSPAKLFISATSVWTGKIRIFDGGSLNADHVMASACLPTLFRAVEIDGEPFWDGGYSGNPALFPLFYHAHCDDILLVQINPIERRETPRSAAEIQNRLTEINFNSGLLRELRTIEFVRRLINSGALSDEDYKRVLMHRIGGDAALAGFSASSRMKADWDMFVALRDIGRQEAKEWLATNYDTVGEGSTLDLRAEYA